MEELLATVLSNCLEPHPFGRRVAALFLLYAIYFKQPLLPKVCLFKAVSNRRHRTLVAVTLIRRTLGF